MNAPVSKSLALLCHRQARVQTIDQHDLIHTSLRDCPEPGESIQRKLHCCKASSCQVWGRKTAEEDHFSKAESSVLDLHTSGLLCWAQRSPRRKHRSSLRSAGLAVESCTGCWPAKHLGRFKRFTSSPLCLGARVLQLLSGGGASALSPASACGVEGPADNALASGQSCCRNLPYAQ